MQYVPSEKNAGSNGVHDRKSGKRHNTDVMDLIFHQKIYHKVERHTENR
jgi:hypothetical protein